jgi:hypothetical protein
LFLRKAAARIAFVMPGLVPGIHVFYSRAGKKGVDGRDKPGHDGIGDPFVPAKAGTQRRLANFERRAGFPLSRE